jgi:hypothetical protein
LDDITAIKEDFLNNLIQVEEEVDGVNVTYYMNLSNDKKYYLTGNASDYFNIGVTALFDHLSSRTESLTAND